jgi:ABC-type sugar transport system substrate-binding protein
MRLIGLAVVVAVSLALSPVAAAAEATKVYRIGFLALQSAADLAPYVNAFRQGLREHAYVEGQNLLIECDSPKAGTIGSTVSPRSLSE